MADNSNDESLDKIVTNGSKDLRPEVYSENRLDSGAEKTGGNGLSMMNPYRRVENDINTQLMMIPRINFRGKVTTQADWENKTNIYKIKPSDSAAASDKKYNPTFENIINFYETNTSKNELSCLDTRLKYQDFVYCKNVNVMPNNRMIILRKYEEGVPDDLFNYVEGGDNPQAYKKQNRLISTMVSWWDNINTTVSISYGEKWKSSPTSLFSVFNEIVTDFTKDSSSSIKGKIDEMSKKVDLENPINSAVFYAALREYLSGTKGQEFFDYSDVFPGRNPQTITEAKIRDYTGGLSSNIKVTFRADYEMRYFNGIDQHVAFFDLMVNTMRMNYEDSISALPIRDTKFMDELINANFKDAFGTLMGFFDKATTKIVSGLRNVVNQAFTGSASDNAINLGDAASVGLRGVLSRYRLQLKGALQAQTGKPSGVYHATIGNPLNPFMCIGDLVPIGENSTINFYNELSYEDVPTGFWVEYTFQSARTRGLQELETIFNAGKGRIYVYPKSAYNPSSPENYWKNSLNRDDVAVNKLNNSNTSNANSTQMNINTSTKKGFPNKNTGSTKNGDPIL